MKLELTPTALVVLACLVVLLTKGVPPEAFALAVLVAGGAAGAGALRPRP